MTVTAAQVYCLDPLKDSRHREATAARDLADWLEFLKLGNKAPRTLDSYERYTAALLRAFPHKRFAEFTDGDLAHVLTKYPAKSRHIVKAAWNSWFKWGYKQRRIPGNPIEMLPEIRYTPNRNYDVFGVGEVEALCALPSPDGPLLALMFWAGLRRSEARYMTGRRLDLTQRQVIVTEGAKGGKSRRVPMTDRVAAATADLLTLEGIADSDYLWYDRPGGTKRVRRSKPISNSTFDLWWQRCLMNADVRRRNPHMARHTFATRLRELGMSLDEIQLLLGHESIRTTSDTYVHSNLTAIGDHLREVVGAL